jgi:hypothetical protein
MMKTTAVQSTPRIKGENKPGTTSSGPGAAFVTIALNMSWQLAIVVLVPIIGGVELDKTLKTSHAFLFVGLVLAVIGSIVVMWRNVQLANKIPVPKLTDAQKRAIKKQYEEDDKDA